MATQTIIISLCLRTKDYCFLTIGSTVSKYCCLLKQYIFCFLNNRQSFWFWLPWKRNLKLNQIPLLSSNSMQSFKQIKQHTPEIMHFHFFIVLQHCTRDIILKSENEANNLQNGDVHPSCPNSWLWNGISREPFGALRSAMARFFFCIFMLFHLSLTFLSTRASLLTLSHLGGGGQILPLLGDFP